jgi:hypothetical protein
MMTMKRAAVYGSAGVLLVAYLAVANSAPPQDRDVLPRRATQVSATSAGTIARDMQTEAARLQERLRKAPAPDSNPRNPFAFGADRSQRPASGIVHATVADTPDVAAAPPIPSLSLIGMAEDSTSKGTRRTAVLSGDGDAVYFVAEGDTLIGRYRVTKIGADAIELSDLQSGGIRRLSMK